MILVHLFAQNLQHSLVEALFYRPTLFFMALRITPRRRQTSAGAAARAIAAEFVYRAATGSGDHEHGAHGRDIDSAAAQQAIELALVSWPTCAADLAALQNSQLTRLLSYAP
ncbi:MAG TPA: hypothetical protein VHU83_20845 [Bryobacteraceae bacterium]|jgi:hypothetical protein|nr:hypothetical protein [Bryobacteraceae bacterium]